MLLALLLPQPSAGPVTVAPASKQAQIPWRIFALFGATFMLYVGVENSLGGWLPTYAQRLSPAACWNVPPQSRCASGFANCSLED